MIEKGLIITGSDAELLSRKLSEVKTKSYEESEAQLDDTQALDALVSGFGSFRNASNDDQKKESRHSYFSPLRKRLVLGIIFNRQGDSGPYRNQHASFFVGPHIKKAKMAPGKRIKQDAVRGSLSWQQKSPSA
jgi:hypothetical protein